MTVFPNCKINLGLNILRKRNDGYHDLETIFLPVPLTDILEIVIYHEHDRSSSIPFTVSGLSIGDDSTNLCLKAYWLLKKDFADLPHIQMHLHKAIPSGAGLGGGSADASFALKIFNDLFRLELSNKKLMEYGMELGSDCPFFIINKPCLASGRGEILEEITLDLSDYKLVLVNPGIHVNTGDAFRQIRPELPDKSIKEIIKTPVDKWKSELCNDFEKAIFKKHREIVDIKDQLYVKGATYASMSGSGSTVFGLFPKQKTPELSFPANYFVKELLLN